MNSMLIMTGEAIRTWQDRIWQSIMLVISGSLQPRMTPPPWTWVGTLWITVGGLAILAITAG